MGTLESKLCQLLTTDDSNEALKFWRDNPDLRKRLDINAGFKWTPNKDPPLHCLLRHGNYRSMDMKALLQVFLEEGANPAALNGSRETAIHIACSSQRQGARENRARSEVLEILLRSLPGQENLRNKGAKSIPRLTKWLEMKDTSHNTPLHLAATSGLLDCVELLLAYGAPLFETNIAKKTPMESAVDAKQMIIAQFLESQMVITADEKGTPESLPHIDSRTQSFYNTDQLRLMQEEFTKEVADKLKIVPDAARSLLSAYGWSRDLLYSAWEQDNKATCAKAGLELSRVQINDDGNELFTSFSSKSCEICFITIPHHDRIEVPCNHYFCRECWASYVQVSVAEGGGKDILCPGHDCSQPVPRDVLAKLVNEELFKKYSDLNIKHFVDSCKDFKWCPFPDCNQAVMKKDGRTTAPELGQRHGINVECGNGHGFCWNCNKHAHEPCECEVWEIWLNEISKMVVKPKLDLKEVADQAEADAQWIINNTKPCPSCNSPIQKNEGCNHMTCRTCRHDFCWVCLDAWSEHSYRTGGYFSCNRYIAQRRANSRVHEVRHNLTKQYRENATADVQRQAEKFKHYHDRYENHLLGINIECQILAMSQAKTRSLMSMRKVVDKKMAKKKGINRQSSEKKPEDDAENFIEYVVRVLLKARRLLATSYGIGYLIPDEKKETREAHDTLQGKLEEVVESLAQMVNRPYLNTPRSEMASRARDVSFICDEFNDVMREVVLSGLKQEPPPKPSSLPPQSDDVDIEIDPLLLFVHLAARGDPQFHEMFTRFLEQRLEDGDDDDDDDD